MNIKSDNTEKLEVYLKTLDNSGMNISRRKIERCILATNQELVRHGVSGSLADGTFIIVQPRFKQVAKKQVEFSQVEVEKFRDGWYITGGRVTSGTYCVGDVYVLTAAAHLCLRRVYSIWA